MEIFKVPLKEICGPFRQSAWITKETDIKVIVACKSVYSYNFDLLKKDLLDNNIINDPIEVTTTSVVQFEKSCVLDKYNKCLDKYNYIVMDGNHRCYVLEEMYGEDYIVDCVSAD